MQYQPVLDEHSASSPSSFTGSSSLGVAKARRRCFIWLALVSLAATLSVPLGRFGGETAGLVKAWRARDSECEDAYNKPGYIYRGEGPTDIRWISYDKPDFDSNPVTLENVLEPPLEKLVNAPPSFNTWIRDAPDLASAPELEFMRGRTVVMVGDRCVKVLRCVCSTSIDEVVSRDGNSHDRRNIEGFCAHHEAAGGVVTSKGGHVATSCHLPVLNFTMASWFHYGLAEPSEDWYMSNLSPVDNPPPYFIEERIDSVFVPDMLDIGQPDLIILNSIYWDLRYVVYKASHEGWAWQLKRVTRPMTWRELEWHRRRLRTMVELFRERFPGVPLMFRLGHSRVNNDHNGNVAIYQMNESAKAMMARLGVPIFPWGPLLEGETDYSDVMHVKPVSQPTYLFGDMALYYLRRAVNGWNKC
ncbi:hypothetical protein OF846_005008 [Rhodotorula toruloides]|nr:hypothetical protein OF846_005008 [Rhodotorula toruloides]